MKSIRHALKAPIAATLLTCLACSGGYTVVETVPPPYPPHHAYRYRHPHDQVVLVYHEDVAVYAVSGHRHCYYYGGRYYRLRDGAWYRTSHIQGPWVVVNYASIPPGLHKKYKATNYEGKKYKKKHHHRG